MNHISDSFKSEVFLKEIAKNTAIARNTATFAANEGVLVYADDDNRKECRVAPISILPTQFAKKLYDQAVELSKLSSILVDRISCDRDFIVSALKGTASVDSFTASLMEIFTDVYINGPKRIESCPRLHLLRTDWMVDNKELTGLSDDTVKQVEINTISAAFAGLSEKISRVHRHCVSRIMTDYFDLSFASAIALAEEACPVNTACSKFCDRLVEGYKAGAGLSAGVSAAHFFRANDRISSQGIALYIVSSKDTNEVDQRAIHAGVEARGVPMVRLTIENLMHGGNNRLRLVDSVCDETGARLFIRPPLDTLGESNLHSTSCSADPWLSPQVDGEVWREVHLIYWRAGYDPSHYCEPGSWAMRQMLERSQAVLVPSIPAQLAGSKKVQQLLNQNEVLTRLNLTEEQKSLFLSGTVAQVDPGVNSARTTCEYTANIIADAISHPERYVLKPQREGGGNNIHGQAIVTHLQRIMQSRTASPYILMQKIHSSARPTLYFRKYLTELDAVNERNPLKEAIGSCELAIGELGIYTGFLVDRPFANRAEYESANLDKMMAGHLLRSKYAASNEGGVAKGFAVIDSPIFV